MTELRDRLQTALSDAYRLERELGGGGMSRVFIAEEVRLSRKVVVKVLPPEMAAGVNIDRFEREIKLAARLQHPHIVPVLSAGASGDLLYYIMPFIEGESLRTKLAREGELPVKETVQILCEVLDALSYAHSEGVVHRDIKPDNVMLSRGHALVTDFGVAKAVSESTGETSLTSLGVALGTPAYMAPEQAAADPHVDHRADIYAVGALAYEMLTGKPPFTGPSPQAVLAAHITQAPEPVTAQRETVPPALNELILRCLAKKAADRPQQADDLVPPLEALLTPSGGLTPTATQPVQLVDYTERARKSHPVRVVGLFVLASVGVLAIIYGLVQALGLPDWVLLGAVALLVLGLPIVVFTGRHERRRARAEATGLHAATPVGLARHATWRKALTGGGVAFAALGVLAVLFMLSRLTGIGPGATLMSAGVLKAHERIVLAEFRNETSDSTLGESVTELLRIDLAQSSAISVMEAGQVSDVLGRMNRSRDEPLTEALAAELAEREGIKAYVTGEVRALGGGYVISARVVDARSGEALVTAREKSADVNQIIEAVDELSGQLRKRIGESLRSVRGEPPLHEVTTSSLESLRLYAQAARVSDRGDYDRAIALLEQATAQDTAFAMAWRRIGMYYTNRADPESQTRGRTALELANSLKNRLSERERYMIEASYAARVSNDAERAVTAYLAILEKHPTDPTALNNIAISYAQLGRGEEHQRYLWQGVEAGVMPTMSYNNIAFGALWLGRPEEAESVATLLAERFPETPENREIQSNISMVRMDLDGATAAAHEMITAGGEAAQDGHRRLAEIATMRGRIADAERADREVLRIQTQRRGGSDAENEMLGKLWSIQRRQVLESDPTRFARRLETLWEQNRTLTADRAVTQRRFVPFITALARAGLVEQARRAQAEFAAGVGARERAAPRVRRDLAMADAQVAMAEGDHGRAIASLEDFCAIWRGVMQVCAENTLVELAEVYDRSGRADSALAIYERWVNLEATKPDRSRTAPIVLRVGELYEDKGEARRAIEYYGRFLELWQDADPELQPLVRDVRQRVARLTRTAG